MVREVELSVLVGKSLASRDQATQLLELLCASSPSLIPQKWGTYEPFSTEFDPQNLEPVLDTWSECFLWKRRHPKAEGAVWPAWHPSKLQSSIDVTADATRADVPGMLGLLREASLSCLGSFGYVHMLTAPEIPDRPMAGTIACLDPTRQRYALIVSERRLRRYLPDLYWAAVFGPPYIELFGRERLLSSPAHIVEDLGGCIYLQLSESIFDLEEDYARVDAVRQAVKRHLGCNAFFDPSRPADHLYNVPDFHLEPLPEEEKKVVKSIRRQRQLARG